MCCLWVFCLCSFHFLFHCFVSVFTLLFCLCPMFFRDYFFLFRLVVGLVMFDEEVIVVVFRRWFDALVSIYFFHHFFIFKEFLILPVRCIVGWCFSLMFTHFSISVYQLNMQHNMRIPMEMMMAMMTNIAKSKRVEKKIRKKLK